MRADWARGVISAAIVLGCVVVAGCEQSYDDWRSSFGPEGSPGLVCGTARSFNKVIPLHFVAWNPDGTSLIFDDVTSVWMVGVYGTWLRKVVDANPGHQFPNDLGMHAEFSPDGQQIVYTTCEYPTEGLRVRGDAPWTPRGEYQYEIGTVSVDGSGAQRRTTNRYYDHLPVWSPDGRRIAYLSTGRAYDDRFLDELHILSAHDGSAEPEALVRDLDIAAPPRWSPDGKQLAVLASERDADVRATRSVKVSSLVIAASGSVPRKVAEAVSSVSWSPDGGRVALAQLHGVGAQLVTMKPDGSDLQVIRRLTYTESFASNLDVRFSVHTRSNVPRLHVAWAPDGTRILYSCGYQFCVVDLDGEIVGRSPEEFAKERGRAAAAWAPDGSRIAVRAAGNPTPNGEVALYTMAPDGSDVRVLVRGGLAMVAEHSEYEDAEVGKAACREGYVVPNPDGNPGLVRDCETLMGLRDALAGPTLLNWGAGTPVAQWAGVQISGDPRRVTGLKFRIRDGVHGHDSLQLIGRVPPAIADLDRLQTLDLSGHTFFDEIPRELERLAHLRELNLRLHRGAWMSGCLSAGFVEQLDVAEGVRVCGQEAGA